MSTSVIVVGVEEVVKAVDTVIRDVVIVSVGVIEVGETMVGKDRGKVEQLSSGKLFQPYSVVKHVHFGNTFLDAMCNQIYFLTVYYISDIQLVFLW